MQWRTRGAERAKAPLLWTKEKKKIGEHAYFLRKIVQNFGCNVINSSGKMCFWVRLIGKIKYCFSPLMSPPAPHFFKVSHMPLSKYHIDEVPNDLRIKGLFPKVCLICTHLSNLSLVTLNTELTGVPNFKRQEGHEPNYPRT